MNFFAKTFGHFSSHCCRNLDTSYGIVIKLLTNLLFKYFDLLSCTEKHAEKCIETFLSKL